jgi:predicted DNA-binding protein (UPF0251 family)
MSGRTLSQSNDVLSTSMQSASNRTPKTLQMLLQQDDAMTTGEPVLLEDSRTTISDVFGRDVAIELDNDLRTHVAMSVVRLRRYRKRTQQSVADEMGTSQPALARIEAADENTTVDTVRKAVVALKGRIRFDIEPEEIDVPRLPPCVRRLRDL